VQQADLVALGDRRLEPGEIAHVLAVEVDVHEAMEVAVGRQQLVSEGRMPTDQ
jgi:hypothetical protein